MSTSDTGLVITDPQNDFLSPDGATWKLVGDSVESNGTVEHLEQLLVAAKDGDHPSSSRPTTTTRTTTSGGSAGRSRR